MDAKNHAESLAYEADRLLSDSKDKIESADAASVREKVTALRAALASKDVALSDLRAKTDDLTSTLHAIARKMYQSGTPPPGGAAQAPPNGEGAGVPPSDESTGAPGAVDADFKVVDKDTGDEKSQS